MSVRPAAELLAQHAMHTRTLVDLLIARGQTQQAAVMARATTIEALSSQGVAITTAREHAIANAARFESEVADLTGQIDATRAQLKHLELVLDHQGDAT